MRGSAAFITGRQVPWLRKHAYAVRLVGCFVCIMLATASGDIFYQGENGIASNLIWVANGMLLAYLLLAPRWHWPAFIGVGCAALLTGNALSAGHLQLKDLVSNGLNICEVLVGALLLRRRSTELPRFTEGGYLLRFLGFAVLTAPLAAGSVYALYAFLGLHASPGHTLLSWVVEDGMGTAVATPAIVALFRTRARNTIDWQHHWIYPALLVGVTIAAIAPVTFPMVFLIYPLLVLTLLRLGLRWATLELLFVAVAFDSLTLSGLGPFAALAALISAGPIVLLEFFVAAGMIVLYSVTMVLEQQKMTERRLQDIVALHNLVSENSRDAIILADWSGRRRYGSAAAKNIEGWKPDALSTEEGLELVHPEDRPKAAAAVRELRSCSESAMVECRMRKQSGDYIWVEANLCVVRDPRTGVRSGILNFIRDITERKQAEKLLQEAYHAVEALSITDALTGLANRRRFDQCLATEWRRGLRDGKPLSLLMIDADLFKSYNDIYGHLQGDNCLKQIAEVALDVVTRPGDLVSRFGGEEFAVILPNTGSEGAMQIAHKICAALRERQIPHQGSHPGIMTVSAGCATMVPSLGQRDVSLVEIADAALYKAKRSGRNQVCRCNAVGASGDEMRTGALSEASIAKTA